MTCCLVLDAAVADLPRLARWRPLQGQGTAEASGDSDRQQLDLSQVRSDVVAVVEKRQPRAELAAAAVAVAELVAIPADSD